MSSPRADEDTEMDTHDLKLSIPETSAGGRSSGDSPESGVSTPRYSEHQSGSKRLRTDCSEEDSGGPHPDDEPGTSAGSLVVTPAEVTQLTMRTKAACSRQRDTTHRALVLFVGTAPRFLVRVSHGRDPRLRARPARRAENELIDFPGRPNLNGTWYTTEDVFHELTASGRGHGDGHA